MVCTLRFAHPTALSFLRTQEPIATIAYCLRKTSIRVRRRWAAAYGSPRSRGRLRGGSARASLHLLIRVDAPQALLLDPAVKTVADHAAPAIGAFLDLGHHAGLQAGRDRAGPVGPIVQRRKLVLGLHGDDSRAAAGQQRMIDPA